MDTFEIELLSPHTAKSRCHVLIYHYLHGGKRGENMIWVGHYEHGFVQSKHGGKWLINKMKLVIDHEIGDKMLAADVAIMKFTHL